MDTERENTQIEASKETGAETADTEPIVEEMESPVEARPHNIALSAWGVPFPVGKGSVFSAFVGAKCNENCNLSGLPLVILDEQGNTLAEIQLGNEVLPQSKGIYYTKIELPAPDDEAVHTCTVRCDAELDIPHRMETAELTYRTAKPPEHTVTIYATQKYDGTKIDEATVMLGLYRGKTDKNGVAHLHVPGGAQTLRLSKRDYISFDEPRTVDGDTEFHVELEFSPVL